MATVAKLAYQPMMALNLHALRMSLPRSYAGTLICQKYNSNIAVMLFKNKTTGLYQHPFKLMDKPLKSHRKPVAIEATYEWTNGTIHISDNGHLSEDNVVHHENDPNTIHTYCFGMDKNQYSTKSLDNVIRVDVRTFDRDLEIMDGYWVCKDVNGNYKEILDDTVNTIRKARFKAITDIVSRNHLNFDLVRDFFGKKYVSK
jgi:hypothetical protein